jgi:type VI protein secretion system component Hcp
MVDAATATLFANAVNGNHFTTAVIQIYRTGASTLCFLEYTLEDVVVTSVVPGVVESLSLSFGRLTQKFIAVNSNGTPQPAVSGVIDLAFGGAIGQPSIPSTRGDSRYDAVDSFVIFAQFDGIVGSATNAQHRDWMDIASVIGGGVVAPTPTGFPGGASGPITFSPITLIKAIDRASPAIFRRAGFGERSNTLLIDICSPQQGCSSATSGIGSNAATAIATDVSPRRCRPLRQDYPTVRINTHDRSAGTSGRATPASRLLRRSPGRQLAVERREDAGPQGRPAAAVVVVGDDDHLDAGRGALPRDSRRHGLVTAAGIVALVHGGRGRRLTRRVE